MFAKRWWQRAYKQFKLKQCEFEALNYLVVDIELTGLDAKQSEIVSIAWLAIEAGRIDLSSAQYHIHKDVKALEQSPVYHGIDDGMLKEGESLEYIMRALSQALYNKVLVCHSALDWPFLKQASVMTGIAVEPQTMVDTMEIEKKRLQSRGQPIAGDGLTLASCRKRYHLPDYQTHHALTDALATAELLLAQVNAMNAGKRIKLADLM
ncbi:DNA polymerase III subunit epsilon [Pseudoalteromonas sp. A25]|uniref:3'-5' exonuclease n=1 Tax=Pseudoalteromonas sp. A25 TaxID=116092 RepID=UPI001260EEB4|nr:3'-5' exonuclease [Pseudoalteromonas sp. A25]BBN82744.1 DNA polymerase III subunit epsilon [Pseudoalteromonas sp. A25]